MMARKEFFCINDDAQLAAIWKLVFCQQKVPGKLEMPPPARANITSNT
jgi:hypothetical protein